MRYVHATASGGIVRCFSSFSEIDAQSQINKEKEGK